MVIGYQAVSTMNFNWKDAKQVVTNHKTRKGGVVMLICMHWMEIVVDLGTSPCNRACWVVFKV